LVFLLFKKEKLLLGFSLNNYKGNLLIRSSSKIKKGNLLLGFSI
jgi:hypothetical protein